MALAILIAAAVIAASIWSLAGTLRELGLGLREDLRVTNARLKDVAKPLAAIRRGLAPTDGEMSEDEPDLDSIIDPDPPWRFYAEMQRVAEAAESISTSLERINARQRRRERDAVATKEPQQ